MLNVRKIMLSKRKQTFSVSEVHQENLYLILTPGKTSKENVFAGLRERCEIIHCIKHANLKKPDVCSTCHHF